jgi:hypothetical protein
LPGAERGKCAAINIFTKADLYLKQSAALESEKSVKKYAARTIKKENYFGW